MSDREVDWLAILSDLLAGDRLALVKINRLITGFLTGLRAYDFHDEWDDLRQEVVLSVIKGTRAARLRDPRAFPGYVRAITRNKFVDRLKTRILMRGEGEDMLPWGSEMALRVAEDPTAEAVQTAKELWAAVRQLPDEQRRVLEGVYGQGKTYEAVACETGLPLGTMKRRLREGLTALRQRFAGDSARDPISGSPQTVLVASARHRRRG